MNNFVRARAITTRTGVSGAVFKAAQKQPGGVQSVFDSPNGFLEHTTSAYVSRHQIPRVISLMQYGQEKHLAVAAKTVYFVPANQTLNTIERGLNPRLMIKCVLILFSPAPFV